MWLLSPRCFRGRLTNLFLLGKARRSARVRSLLQCYFDPAYYLARYPDVANTKVDPFWHYLLQGAREGRNPSSRFSTRDYLRCYPDVARAGLNPLLHYAIYGRGENRKKTRSRDLALGASNETPPDKRTILENTPWANEAPLVSVIITSPQPGAHLEEAIRSVLAQTFISLEVIVIGGGATDNETVRKCRELEEASRRGVRFLYPDVQPGAGRNQAISAAHGRYVCCVDADDLLKPVYVEVAVFLAEGYGYHLVYPSASVGAENGWEGVVEDVYFPEILDANPVFDVALFRKDAWAGVGGYRDWGPRDARALEVWDLWVRLLAQGARAKGIDARSLLYRAHNRSLTGSCETDADDQRPEIRRANAAIFDNALPSEPLEVRVMNPWINLHRKADEKSGFLLALPFITLGGAETLLRSVSQALVDRGRRLIVMTTLGLHPDVKDDSASFEAITPHVYPLPTLFGDHEERWEDFLRYLLVHYDASTIMIAGSEFVYRVLPAVRSEFRSVRVVDQLFNDQVHLPNNRQYSRYIDVTVVPTQGFADTLLHRYGESPERVAVIPHGVCTRGPQLEDRDTALGASGLPAVGRGKFLVSFFGRLAEEKAPDVFVEIARLLRQQDQIYFCMTGAGPLRAAILGLIERYKLQGRIYAPGFVEDVSTLMELSDVVVVPSRIDGMPLVVLEAQAMGKPVVASAVGSIPEMIKDNQTGFLCEPGNAAAFCQRILELLRSPQRCREIGAAAQAAVRRAHDQETMVAAYVKVFQGNQ